MESMGTISPIPAIVSQELLLVNLRDSCAYSANEMAMRSMPNICCYGRPADFVASKAAKFLFTQPL